MISGALPVPPAANGAHCRRRNVQKLLVANRGKVEVRTFHAAIDPGATTVAVLRRIPDAERDRKSSTSLRAEGRRRAARPARSCRPIKLEHNEDVPDAAFSGRLSHHPRTGRDFGRTSLPPVMLEE